ncbi:MAG: 6-phospho-3-hexuloisomerase [Thermoprotei archaeon]|nr:MAG: 6-phospho-3-hexuloisomerase [Thermoprotei archaeon]HDD64411.1 SIS domain-containing protein [Thermoprotei archaeon]
MFKNFNLSIREIIEHLSEVEKKLDANAINNLIGLILNSRNVFCYGAGRSGFIARCFVQRLAHIGFKAYFIGETVTPKCGREDLVIIISGSGATASCICFAKKAKEIGAKIVAITANPSGKLSKYTDLIVHVPGKTKLLERKSYAPFTSLFDIAVLSVCDSIISEIMGRLGISEDMILERHANIE